ncbi:uncharacterized protein LOC126781332 [Nymphalis io]|uniref:uncharacterized protein LOC126781332 n=1 Tax=Inachis io TaxID=171585 RepID=UPI00216723BE|nr:uncharacterized protein LOC126781332 [Nymphalis io]XP_050362230.1 uncharacterized protein LOC126781332 [Nymphalis io]
MYSRYDNLLFNYETTYRTDFRDGEIKKTFETVYKTQPKCFRIRPPPLKYIHTLSEWKQPGIPIELYNKPKETVRTNPHQIQEYYEKPPDVGWENAVKTRPRLVMTPAISMDDIASPEKRKLLIKDVYASSAHRSMREGIPKSSGVSVLAPLSGTLAPANPITFQNLQAPFVSPEWRMDSVSWDGRQLRSHCDPDKEFYLPRSSK